MRMHPTLIIPTLLIVEYLVAAGVFFWYGQWKRGIYYIAAAVLNATVSF